MSTHAELEVLRAEFERVCKLPAVLKQVNFPLGTMEVNGAFHHYMDSDTDSAWIGFKFGYVVGQRTDASNAGEAAQGEE